MSTKAPSTPMVARLKLALKLFALTIVILLALLFSPMGEGVRDFLGRTDWSRVFDELSGSPLRRFTPGPPAAGTATKPLGDYPLSVWDRNMFRAHYGPTPDAPQGIYPDEVLVRDDLDGDMLKEGFSRALGDCKRAHKAFESRRKRAMQARIAARQAKAYEPDEEPLPASGPEQIVATLRHKGTHYVAVIEVVDEQPPEAWRAEDARLSESWRELRAARQRLCDYVEALKLPK